MAETVLLVEEIEQKALTGPQVSSNGAKCRAKSKSAANKNEP
jgi:hypothetical protein